MTHVWVRQVPVSGPEYIIWSLTKAFLLFPLLALRRPNGKRLCRTILGTVSPSAWTPLHSSQKQKSPQVRINLLRGMKWRRNNKSWLSIIYILGTHFSLRKVGAGLPFCIFHWSSKKINIFSKVTQLLCWFQSSMFYHFVFPRKRHDLHLLGPL